MRRITTFYYSILVMPVNGEGQCYLADETTPNPGETPEACLRREATEAGWQILKIESIYPAVSPRVDL